MNVPLIALSVHISIENTAYLVEISRYILPINLIFKFNWLFLLTGEGDCDRFSQIRQAALYSRLPCILLRIFSLPRKPPKRGLD